MNIKKTLYKLDEYICVILLIAIFIDVCLQILSRVLPGNAISWTVEVATILLGALIWMGISMSISKGGHIAFDLFTINLTKKVRKKFRIAGNIIFIVYFCILSKIIYSLLLYYLEIGQCTTLLRINLFYVRLPMMVGCIATILKLIIETYAMITSSEEKLHRLTS